MNFAVHAAKFEEIDVSLFGIVGDDAYRKVIFASIADKRINTEHVRVEKMVLQLITEPISPPRETGITRMIHGMVRFWITLY